MNKAKRLILSAAMALSAAGLTGCGGINASQSVSPATFLIPGIVSHEPAPAIEPVCQPVEQVALLIDPLN